MKEAYLTLKIKSTKTEPLGFFLAHDIVKVKSESESRSVVSDSLSTVPGLLQARILE